MTKEIVVLGVTLTVGDSNKKMHSVFVTLNEPITIPLAHATDVPVMPTEVVAGSDYTQVSVDSRHLLDKASDAGLLETVPLPMSVDRMMRALWWMVVVRALNVPEVAQENRHERSDHDGDGPCAACKGVKRAEA